MSLVVKRVRAPESRHMFRPEPAYSRKNRVSPVAAFLPLRNPFGNILTLLVLAQWPSKTFKTHVKSYFLESFWMLNPFLKKGVKQGAGVEPLRFAIV